MTGTRNAEKGFTLTRTIDAPPAAVWQAWTDPAHLDWFFNPQTTPRHPTTVDLRVGGAWRQHMVIDAGTEYITGGVYREIVPAKRLVFTWGASGGWPDTDGPDAPLVTIDLTPSGDKTTMDLTLEFPEDLSEEEVQAWMNKGIEAGMAMTIDRLVARFRR